MAIASIIISSVGLVLSFIIGFPWSYFFGPIIGMVFGIVGLILASVAHRQNKSGVSKAGIIISSIVLGFSVIRAISVASCVSRVSGCVSTLIANA